MKKLLAILLLVMVSVVAASAESPSIDKLTKIEDGWMKLSAAPNNVMPHDMIRVDMDLLKVWNDDLADVNISLPMVPDNLDGVILTDGYHISEAICVPEGNTLHLSFHVNELKKFDSTVGLWLVTLIKLK